MVKFDVYVTYDAETLKIHDVTSIQGGKPEPVHTSLKVAKGTVSFEKES